MFDALKSYFFRRLAVQLSANLRAWGGKSQAKAQEEAASVAEETPVAAVPALEERLCCGTSACSRGHLHGFSMAGESRFGSHEEKPQGF